MFTGRVDAARLRKSVLSVPPLARSADLGVSEKANGALLRHLRGGGVTTFLYGGNANLYNVGVSEFGRLLDMFERLAEPDDWFIPSVGADFGKACDQLDLMKGRAFPTAMLLPLRFPATPAGLAKGVAALADRLGRPLILYVKDEGFTTPADVARLLRDGAICAVKYAIARQDAKVDPFLAELIGLIGADLIVSGMGERPIVEHAEAFGLRAFTSGSVCVAPRLASELRLAIQAGDLARARQLRSAFMPLEELRDAHSPLRVLHAAVGLADVADMGPIQPFLSEIVEPGPLAAIAAAARDLRAANDRPQAIAAE